MNRNAKIALGCGGAGCLGLIVVVIAVALLIVFGVIKAPGIYNPNRNSNHNYNFNSNSNNNSNSNSNDNLNTNSDSSSSSSSMSDDDKHKLLMAASFANDTEMMQRVMRKLGFITDTGVAPDYAQFLQEHAEWAHRNQDFINSVNTEESARAYLNAHIDD
jgi:cytoskeletal protein RodZ